MSGGEHLHTLEDHKAEAFINAVDIVVHLHDPSRSSTERTAPPCSAHVQLDDVLAFLLQHVFLHQHVFTSLYFYISMYFVNRPGVSTCCISLYFYISMYFVNRRESNLYLI